MYLRFWNWFAKKKKKYFFRFFRWYGLIGYRDTLTVLIQIITFFIFYYILILLIEKTISCNESNPWGMILTHKPKPKPISTLNFLTLQRKETKKHISFPFVVYFTMQTMTIHNFASFLLACKTTKWWVTARKKKITPKNYIDLRCLIKCFKM